MEHKEKYRDLVERYNQACHNVDAVKERLDAAQTNDDTSPEERDKLVAEFSAAVTQRDGFYDEMREKEKLEEARNQHRPISFDGKKYVVTEPDIYRDGGEHNFMSDLYNAQLRNDPTASERIGKHQRHEIEKRSVTSSTLGGIIPPAYLIDMYAKASRNGRVFADQCNNQPLPDTGMSVVLPRLTQGTAAASQATENTTVTTQDPTETDLSLNVRTIAGYSPVSRQALERAAYSDRILFEDLIARYWAQLDTQALNGGGGSGTLLGLLQTSSIATSAASTITAAGVYPKVADVIQQISTNVGGLGYVADKIVMHPRRWGFFAAALDSQNRPLVVPEAGAMQAINAMGEGNISGYAGPVGRLQGLPVFLDANVPTNLGTNTNEDRIIVFASPVVHLFERANDPVTLSFEQQAGTSLQVQLICYGYVAFTAGRYPGASGAVTGLTPPTF